ncbi:MAG: YtxH domain-containing protein [Bacteroidetes bacterium]|nr:YtxH domain-containing protein [Bacteroidota bacterium]
MGRTGKTIATLFVGAAIGAAVGYLLATDKEKRQEDLTKIKDRVNGLKDKIKDRMAKTTEDLEHDIYHT